jgi:hypothetical protein
LLSSQIGNAPLEYHLLVCSKAGIAATLSVSTTERRTDISILSFEALDDLLLNWSFLTESEDELLWFFLNLESCSDFLVQHRRSFFTGSSSFQEEEIEVLEITDQIALLPKCRGRREFQWTENCDSYRGMGAHSEQVQKVEASRKQTGTHATNHPAEMG